MKAKSVGAMPEWQVQWLSSYGGNTVEVQTSAKGMRVVFNGRDVLYNAPWELVLMTMGMGLTQWHPMSVIPALSAIPPRDSS